MDELLLAFDLQENALAHLTSSVQLGFILGTLVFAILSIADRFSPSKVFLVCALLGALFNLGIVWEGHNLASLILLRAGTGFFLAGIYPVGMKIAADYYEQGLGKSLGFLVGALVLGTGFPHALKLLTASLPWRSVLFGTSGLAAIGGIMMWLLVPDGPFRKAAQQFQLSSFLKVFQNKPFRAAALGYFGHMWELYTFWAFIPVMLFTYQHLHPELSFNIPLWSFLIIGIGSLSCIVGGYLSLRFGPGPIAKIALSISGILCLFSPLLFLIPSPALFLLALLIWGAFVIMDSPLFSTLVAQNAAPEIKGTALTIVNSIGFFLTIPSLQLMGWLQGQMDPSLIYLVLGIGPVLGLLGLRGYTRSVKANWVEHGGTETLS